MGRTSGDVQCDYTDVDSVEAMYREVDAADGLVCVAGKDSTFKPFASLTDEDYSYGFERKTWTWSGVR